MRVVALSRKLYNSEVLVPACMFMQAVKRETRCLETGRRVLPPQR